jgi:hypothetical protein
MADERFLLDYSIFERKEDASFAGDPNGDYVMAADVNELQIAIERLERTIGIGELPDSIVDVLKQVRKPSFLQVPNLTSYFGSPTNAYPVFRERVEQFKQLGKAILKQQTDVDFQDFLEEVGTDSILGYVLSSDPIETIRTQVLWWKDKGVSSIYLDSFDLQYNSREKQNTIIDLLREQEMVPVYTGDVSTLFLNGTHANNPLQIPLSFQKGDGYYRTDLFLYLNTMRSSTDILNDIQLLEQVQTKGITLFVEDSLEGTISSTQSQYETCQWLAILFQLDYYGTAISTKYQLNEKIQLHTWSKVYGEWKTTARATLVAEEVIRTLPQGNLLTWDTTTNQITYSGFGLPASLVTWQDKQIPGAAVNLTTADWNTASNTVIQAINDNANLKIHYSKIEGLSGGASPDSIKDIVIQSINDSPAAHTLHSPDGFLSIAGGNYIHGGMIDYLDASSIKTGSLSLESMKANSITAINAYIGEAKIDSAKIGDLTAEHIWSEVVEAINLYAERAVIDRAYIDGSILKDATIYDGKIFDLSASKLTAGTINTAQVTLSGTNGHMVIHDNNIKIYDDVDGQGIRHLRTVLGETSEVDTQGDPIFGLMVYGKDGTTRLFDNTGVYNAGIHDNAVSNQKLQDEAVNSRVLAVDSVLAKHILANEITGIKIASDTLEARNFKSNSIHTGLLYGGGQLRPVSDNKSVSTNRPNLLFFGGPVSKGLVSGYFEGAVNDSFTIDLGSVMSHILEINFTTHEPNVFANLPKDYKIETSANGSVWSTLVNITGNDEFYISHQVDPTQARYVKFTLLAPQTGQTVSRIANFRVMSLLGGTIISGNSIQTGVLDADLVEVIHLKAGSITVGFDTTFEDGYDPSALLTENQTKWNNAFDFSVAVSNDSVLSPYEKRQVKKEFDTISSSYQGIITQANYYWAAKPSEQIALETAFQTLNTYLYITPDSNGLPLLDPANMDRDSTISKSEYDAKFITYYDKENDLASAIAIRAYETANNRQASGYMVNVISTNGTIFNAHGNLQTDLVAQVVLGTSDITASLGAERFSWRRKSTDLAGDLLWNDAHKGMKTVTIDDSMVPTRATFFVDVDLDNISQ